MEYILENMFHQKLKRDVCELSFPFLSEFFSVSSDFTDDLVFDNFLLFLFLSFFGLFSDFKTLFSLFKDFSFVFVEVSDFLIADLDLNPLKLSGLESLVMDFLVLDFFTLIFLDLKSFTSSSVNP